MTYFINSFDMFIFFQIWIFYTFLLIRKLVHSLLKMVISVFSRLIIHSLFLLYMLESFFRKNFYSESMGYLLVPVVKINEFTSK